LIVVRGMAVFLGDGGRKFRQKWLVSGMINCLKVDVDCLVMEVDGRWQMKSG
jgi:hypothetical protein